MAENQDQQPQSTITHSASCHKRTCSYDLEDQKVYSALCFRPYSKWALTSSWTERGQQHFAEIKSRMFEWMSKSAKWNLTYRLEARKDGDGKKSRMYQVYRQLKWCIGLAFSQLKILAVLNLLVCDLFGKNQIHYCISFNGRLYVILFYQMKIGGK